MKNWSRYILALVTRKEAGFSKLIKTERSFKSSRVLPVSMSRIAAFVFLERPSILVYLVICWAGCSTAWDVPRTMVLQ